MSIASNPAEATIARSLVEARAVGLERLEGGVRRHVERPPLVRGAVAQLPGDEVRAHEREGQRGQVGVKVVAHVSPRIAAKWSSVSLISGASPSSASVPSRP